MLVHAEYYRKKLLIFSINKNFFVLNISITAIIILKLFIKDSEEKSKKLKKSIYVIYT